ncbi:MAG: glycosyltransferase family 4 protein, partial [Planctomycetes bacterium]|nr:glycosyltransferase family 4 protein [Planctomycetota bacterium]
MLRIGIDARMAQHTGIGRYVRNVVRHVAALAPDITFVVFVNPSQDRSWLPTAGNVEARELPREVGVYSLAEHTTLPKALRRAGLDLVHFPSFNAPRFCSLPQVVTIHDLIYLLFPESCPSRLAAWYARKMLRTASGRARLVITVSEHGREDVVKHLGLPREKVRPTPEAADEMVELAGRVRDPDALLARFGPLRPYLLYVGNLAPHKNIAGLLAACARVRESHPALRLVVV